MEFLDKLRSKTALHGIPAMPGACQVPAPGGGGGVKKRGGRQAPPRILKKAKKASVPNFGGQSGMLEAEKRVLRLIESRSLDAAVEFYLKSGDDVVSITGHVLQAILRAGDMSTFERIATSLKHSTPFQQSDAIDCLLLLPQHICVERGKGIVKLLSSITEWPNTLARNRFERSSDSIVQEFLKEAESCLEDSRNNIAAMARVSLRAQTLDTFYCYYASDAWQSGVPEPWASLHGGCAVAICVDTNSSNCFCECEVVSDQPLTVKPLDIRHEILRKILERDSTCYLRHLASRFEYARALEKLRSDDSIGMDSTTSGAQGAPDDSGILQEAVCIDSSDDNYDDDGCRLHQPQRKAPTYIHHVGKGPTSCSENLKAESGIAKQPPSPFLDGSPNDPSSLGLIARVPPKAKSKTKHRDSGIAGLGGYGSSSSEEDDDDVQDEDSANEESS